MDWNAPLTRVDCSVAWTVELNMSVPGEARLFKISPKAIYTSSIV